jgi:hypothetical protein
MALNASGPISLAGTAAGQSIQLELGGTAGTPIGLNCASVRSLAGVASGAITMPTNFYGKSSGPTVGLFYGGGSLSGSGCTPYVNIVTRINACGALVGSQTNVSTIKTLMAGAKVGANGLFYGGVPTCGCLANAVRRINACGALVGSQTNAGTGRYTFAGASVGANGLFYAGATALNIVTRINACGALVGSQTNVGTARRALAGALVGANGLFYAGRNTCADQNLATRINACGALVGSETSVGIARCSLGGALVGSNGLFFAGAPGSPTNTVTRINACGALVGSETNVGTSRQFLSGADVGSNGLFYGGSTGFSCLFPGPNTVTRINTCGALVGSQTNVGTARSNLAGAGL